MASTSCDLKERALVCIYLLCVVVAKDFLVGSHALLPTKWDGVTSCDVNVMLLCVSPYVDVWLRTVAESTRMWTDLCMDGVILVAASRQLKTGGVLHQVG